MTPAEIPPQAEPKPGEKCGTCNGRQEINPDEFVGDLSQVYPCPDCTPKEEKRS